MYKRQALVYGALGLLVVLTGSVFGALHASPIFTGAIAVLFFVLALAMFDVWQLDFSRFRKGGGAVGKVRVPAVLVMGGISALLADVYKRQDLGRRPRATGCAARRRRRVRSPRACLLYTSRCV